MAVKVSPPDGYLKKFSNPIWEKLALSDCKALWLVEGSREGHPFTILGLKHLGVKGMMAGDNGATQVSTVFIIPIPDTTKLWKLTREFPNVRVWADTGHVYLIDPGEDIPVADWNDFLLQTLALVETLTEVTRDEWTQVNTAHFANFSDSTWIGTYLFLTGALTIAQCFYGPYYLYSLFSRGFIYSCDGHDYAKLGFGWIAWVYAALLCLPWIGHLHALRSILRYRGHGGFALRMVVNTLLTVVLGASALLPERYVFKSYALPNQQQVSCKVSSP